MFAVGAGGEAGELLEVADEVGIGTEADALGNGLHRELSVMIMVVDAAARLADAVVIEHFFECVVVMLVQHLRDIVARAGVDQFGQAVEREVIVIDFLACLHDIKDAVQEVALLAFFHLMRLVFIFLCLDDLLPSLILCCQQDQVVLIELAVLLLLLLVLAPQQVEQSQDNQSDCRNAPSDYLHHSVTCVQLLYFSINLINLEQKLGFVGIKQMSLFRQLILVAKVHQLKLVSQDRIFCDVTIVLKEHIAINVRVVVVVPGLSLVELLV